MKFYNLEFGPYGSESVIGTLSESQYNYWSKNDTFLGKPDHFDFACVNIVIFIGP